MTAIDYLRERGLNARANGKRIIVSPASRLTGDVRQFVKAHRLELLAELAANDGHERRSTWRILIPGYRPVTMICEPITHTEAHADARSRWPDAEVLP
jgi:hypothetical protein